MNISSTSSRVAPFGVYGAMKSAINILNADLRAELQDEPIRVSGILPGAASTALARSIAPEFAAAVGRVSVSIDELVITPQADVMRRL